MIHLHRGGSGSRSDDTASLHTSRVGASQMIHGKDCPKVSHDGKVGCLHDDKDDSPYDVDGVYYCGRCHVAIDPSLLKCVCHLAAEGWCPKHGIITD